MQTQLKNQLDDIRPGEFALVKCVKVSRYNYREGGYRIFEQIPILPYPPHSDKEILKFPDPHYHLDLRFLPFDVVERFLPDDVQLDPEEWPNIVLLESEVESEIFELHLKCEREMPIMGDFYDFLRALEDEYVGQSLADGDICPHKGFKMIKNPHIEKGFSTKIACAYACPGHGLGCGANRKILRRTKPVIERFYGTGEIED